MPTVTTGHENGHDIEIFYKDWGTGQPVVFSHGWPLTADVWDGSANFIVPTLILHGDDDQIVHRRRGPQVVQDRPERHPQDLPRRAARSDRRTRAGIQQGPAGLLSS